MKSVFQVVERGTNKVVGTHATYLSARRSADRKDLLYGCIRYFVREVMA